MIIKSLELLNFRQYKGNQKISFSIDPEKNVTVIKGENGAGKTTLLEAFTWCLYGRLTLPNERKLVTSDIENKMKTGEDVTVFVEINFIHNNEEYYINRRNVFRKGGTDELNRVINECKLQRKKANGALEPLDEDELEKIVPSDLATYFFFDGERIENLSKLNRDGKKDLNQAIRNILGLNVVLNSQKHLEKVVRELENDFSNDTQNEFYKVKTERDSKEILLKQKMQSVENCDKQLEIIISKLDNISKEMKVFDELRVIEKERDEKLKLLAEEENMLIKCESDIKKINKRNFPDFLAKKVLCLCEDKINLNSLEKRGIIGVDGAAIDELISRGTCICGQDISKGSPHYETLLKQKDYQPPASLGTIINQFTEKTNKINLDAAEYISEVKEKFLYREETKDKIEILKDELEKLNNKLIGNSNAKKLQEERLDFEKDKDKYNAKKAILEYEIKTLETEITTLNDKLENLIKKGNTNKLISLRMDYAKELLKEMKDYYCKKEKAIKEQLNKRVIEIFNELLCTNHKIEIKDDYSFNVYDIDGNQSTSQGQDVITSFAFIGGIIDLAKEKHNEIEVDEPYPLIMDAPFAKLSKTHRRNVAKLLPNIAEQFILITVDSQYEGDIEENLRHKIGNKYELIMHIEDTKYTEIVRR